jgi:hypothetical protein
MSKFDKKLWGIRVRKVVIASLILPFFTAVTAVSPQIAYAVPVTASDGSCVQDVGNSTDVTVTRIGNDCIVVFTSRTATTWRAPVGVSTVRYLVVGGGASADRGICGTYWGRGGGGGQVRDSTLNVVAGTSYTVAVGKGGDGREASCPNVGGNPGAASQFANIIASPGSGGDTTTAKGGVSGSGRIGGEPTAALGGGGGGGAGVAGSGKNGGAGINSNITGSEVMYGSGGAGRDNNGTGSIINASGTAIANSGAATGAGGAAANRGGGGADYGSGWYAGADGVVIVRYTFVTFPTSTYNPTTLSVGAGVGGRSDTFTASGGTGALRFSLSPVRSGFSIDTTTANGAALVVSSLVATGTYLETITVTDTAGYTANHVVTVTVAAPVKWSVANPTSLTTTLGTAASSRLDITGGTTGRVVTLTRPTNVPLSGITIDTSTAITSNFVTLNVSTRVLPGTYSLTVSVIDSSRIRSNQLFTVIVNRLPSLSFTNGTAETTTVVRSGLHLQYEIGQSYTGSGTTVLDLSGNNRNGLITSGIPYSSALGGGSVSVNATRYLQVQPGVITNSDSISRFYWIYPRSATQTLLTVCNSNCTYIESELELFNSRLFARVWDLTSVSTQETLTLNTWHYVGYIYEGDTKRTSIYINGQLSASAVSTGTRGAPSGDQFELMGYNTNTRMQTNIQGDYSLGSVHYYKRVLTESEIFTNFSATAPRFLGTAFPGLLTSGSATITTTQGLSSSHSLFSATEGTGGKVITLSSASAGVTLDTSTANSAILNIANTVAATNSTTQKTISTSVVATDSVSATTTYPLTLRINPPVLISASIPLTLTTTFGRVAYDTFTATQGTGNKTFTGVSSAFQSAFVLTSPSTNVALLTVSATLPAGTYLETITATDSLGAKTDYVLTVVVNPAPTIAGATGNSLSTTLSRTASLRINVVGGTGARTITWTSPNAGITIDSSTIASQNFITLSVSASVPVRSYSFVITATDSLSVRVSDTFTVIVNRSPVIAMPTSVSSNLRLSLDAGNVSSYSGSGTTWSDLSGNGKNATWLVSPPTFTSDFEGAFSRVQGTAQHATTQNLGSSDVFTVETWVRLDSLNTAGTPAGSGFPCVVTDDFLLGVINYSICFAGNNTIRGGYWRTDANKWVYTSDQFTPNTQTWYHLVYTVSKSGSNYISTLYQNGNAVGTPTTDPMIPGNSGGSTYIGKRWGAFTEYINGLIPIVRVYNRALTREEVIQNYIAQGSRFVNTNSGSETLTVTQGVAGSLLGVVATQGTGSKTLAHSTRNSGISIETATANTFSLTLANTLTATSSTVARTLTETVTATDAAGATTSRIYTVVINPPIRVESTTSTITTTSGIVAWDTFTATLGTGSYTFALSGTPNTNGFTLTQTGNRAVLRVGSTVNPGTYNLTITVTDSVSAVTTVAKTVVVNARPTISGNANMAGTTGYAFSSQSYSAVNGTGTLTYSITTVPATAGRLTSGITLSATTGSPTINVSTSVLPDTYTVTLRATDSLTAFGTFIVTLRINETATITGTRTLTKVYGEDLSQVFATGGGTAPWNLFSSNICSSAKSTYTDSGVTYTVERFNGIGTCKWVVPTNVTNASVLVVGGGGGGGGVNGGGGGGGAVLYGENVTISPTALIDISVGGGGSGGSTTHSTSTGSNGGDSAFGVAIAKGGGAGGGYGWTTRSYGYGASGGSGGGHGEISETRVGASSNQSDVTGYVSYKNVGGALNFSGGSRAGTGGGGAGAAGGSVGSQYAPGAGGVGISNSITGTATFYAGGGGGSVWNGYNTPGAGGNGGGAAGSSFDGNAATANTGGGGGGSMGIGGSGGSGTVIVRYVTPAVDTQSARITMDTLSQTPAGVIRLNAPRLLAVGTYTQTISARDSASATPSIVVTLVVTKATPTLSLSLPGSVTTAKYGNPVAISAVTTIPGNVAFVNGSETITACSAVATTAGLATCSWTPTVVGSTTLRAILTPTDTTNYNSSALVSLPITVAKADTLTVTVTSLTRQFTGSAVAVTGAFTTTGLVAIDTLTAISMRYSGTANTGTFRSETTAPTDAGTYTIAPNFPANASAYTFGTGSLGTTSSLSNYESVTVVAGTLTINRAPQVMSFTYPNSNTATYSPTGTITSSSTTRLDSAARTYSSSTLTKCTIDSATAVISIVEAGSCQVAMAVAQTANYLGETATATVTINKATRTFSLTPAVATLKYTESTTVTTTLSAGASDGTISYILGSPAGCTFDPLTGVLLAISGTIQCPLRATISEGINYLAETTTAISLTIARADAPVITIDTVTAMSHTPGVRALVTPNYRVSGLKDLDTAGSLTLTYSFVSNPFESFTYSDTRTPIDAGTYRITPSALTLSVGLMSNYETPTYSASAIDFIINRINQETVTVINTNSEVDVPFALYASGGSTTEGFTFTLVSGSSCSISGSQLSATAAGTCVVTVTRGGDRNYLPATSESVTVRVRNFVIVVAQAPSNPVTGITIIPSTPPLTKAPDSNACTTGCVPKISAIDVLEGAEGDLVVMTGLSFNGVTKVYFRLDTVSPTDDVEAPNFAVDSDTQISVRVPAGLVAGEFYTIRVATPEKTSARFYDIEILP